MSDYQSLSHSKWDCKYHVVFVPKRRCATLWGKIRQPLGPMFHELARPQEGQILQGHIMPDHVHMLISIAPKHKVAGVIGFLKGKSAIAIARRCSGRERNEHGSQFPGARICGFNRWLCRRASPSLQQRPRRRRRILGAWQRQREAG